MIKRLLTILVLVGLGASTGGCSKCGWFWETGPRSCQSDRVR